MNLSRTSTSARTSVAAVLALGLTATACGGAASTNESSAPATPAGPTTQGEPLRQADRQG